jgi:hypothetical protein
MPGPALAQIMKRCLYLSIIIELANDKPVGDIRNAPFDVFLPNKQDCEMLRQDFIALISRVLVQYLPELEKYGCLVPSHIQHEKSSEMAKKIDIVSVLLY